MWKRSVRDLFGLVIYLLDDFSFPLLLMYYEFLSLLTKVWDY